MTFRFRPIVLSAALILTLGTSLAALFSNGGFEGGDLTGWTETVFRNTSGLTGAQPYTGASITRAAGGVDWTTVEGGPAVAPLSLSDPRAGSGVQYPRFGHYAARVNYAGVNYPNYNANTIVQQTVVGSADVDPYDNQIHVRFGYLPVVQDGGHSAAQQAYFYVALRNVTQGNAVLYQRFVYANEAGVPWQTANGYQFTGWQVVDIAPGNSAIAVGDTIEIEVVASGCSQGGHGAWVYVDAFGSEIPGGSIVTSAASSVRPGDPLSYRFHLANDGDAPLDATITRITIPAQTTFASVSDNRCSHSAGVVTCNFGSLPVGATIDFDTVVTVGGAASGTISMGAYSIEGTGYPALLGPAFTTLVDINANRSPDTVTDAYSLDEDGVLNVAAPGVLANDSDADGQSLTATIMGLPAHGTLILNADGGFSYTPAPGYNGPDSFSYRASDGTAQSPVTAVSLTVNSVNDAPTAFADGFTTDEDTPLGVPAPGVLANDTDPEGQSLQASLVSGPSHGTLVLGPDGSFTYTPAPHYAGSDSFTYRASDGGAQSSPVTVNLTVSGQNDAPTATGDMFMTSEDVPLTIPAPGLLANDSDVDGQPLTALLVSGPSHGTLVLNPNGSFSYTPAADYFGPDSFTYRASDGTLQSSPAVVTLAISSVEDISWSPRSGRASGGVRVTITGSGFGTTGTPVSIVIGGVPGLGAEILSDGALTFVTPALPAGTHLDIRIELPGRPPTTLTSAYLPVADPTPTAGPTDTDGDGLPDEWELRYGLDPTDPGDAPADADGDGLSNLTEHTNGTHPTATYKRYFAEGLNHPQVVTMLAFANASPATARVRISFFRQGAPAVGHELMLSGRSRLSLDTKTILGLDDAAFGIEVEANEAVAVDRTMSWNLGGEGSTTERAVEAAASWYFAEGATTGGFSLFYLLTNPEPLPATATVRFLPQVGDAVELTQVIPPFARVTIPVNTAVPSLASADLGAVVMADRPIVVERSMYLSTEGRTWVAGHAGTGLTQPATRLYFAEGASGDFFDAWFLLSNPGTVDATVTVRYVADNGTDATTSHTVPAGRRTTIRAASDVPALLGSSFATTVTSTNQVAIVAERAMWWQASDEGWSEGHVGTGLATPGVAWGAADGVAAADGSSDTFVLVANTSAEAGSLAVTALFDDGTPAIERTLPIAAASRLTIRARELFPEVVGKGFSIIVESVGASPVPLVVDHSLYWNTGEVAWGAGSSAPATRIR